MNYVGTLPLVSTRSSRAHSTGVERWASCSVILAQTTSLAHRRRTAFFTLTTNMSASSSGGATPRRFRADTISLSDTDRVVLKNERVLPKVIWEERVALAQLRNKVAAGYNGTPKFTPKSRVGIAGGWGLNPPPSSCPQTFIFE